MLLCPTRTVQNGAVDLAEALVFYGAPTNITLLALSSHSYYYRTRRAILSHGEEMFSIYGPPGVIRYLCEVGVKPRYEL